MKLIALPLLMFMIALNTYSQNNDCPTAIHITEFPISGTWCFDDTPEVVYSILSTTPIYGCYNCIVDAIWFTWTTGNDPGQVYFDIDSDLCYFPPSTCGIMASGYSIFTDCPENGGVVISSSYDGSHPDGDCWTFNDPNIINDWVFEPSSGTVSGMGAPNVFSTPDDWMINFNLQANTTYYMAVYPKWDCFSQDTPQGSWGCIEINASSPIFLNIITIDVTTTDKGFPYISSNLIDYIVERSTNLQDWIEVDQYDDTLIDSGVYYYRCRNNIGITDVKAYIYNHNKISYMMFDTAGRRYN